VIVIQLVLIGAFLALALRFMQGSSSHRMRAWEKIIGILFFFLAIFAVLFPDDLTRTANMVGVGRGADLLLYLLVLAFIFSIFKLYIKEKQDNQRFVGLARKMAIIEANQNPHNIKQKLIK
jgi:hypothetical protein